MSTLRQHPRGRAWLSILAMALGSSACAVTFPDHGEGAGGGAASSSVSATTTGGTTASGSTTTGVTSGGGEGGSASGGGGGGGGGGGSPTDCVAPEECDDENPCTADGCVDLRCVNVAVEDGPLVDDETDCVDVVCQRGREIPTPDDTEDPPDTSPPCDVAICEDGAPVQVLADPGTPCGDDPLECDGRGVCAGCDGSPANECGAPTACSEPSCDVAEGVCDPSFTDEDPDDPADGDCKALDCPGDQAEADVVDDDTDHPNDLPCSDRGCSGGNITSPVRAEGLACLVGSGVCDGIAAGASSCKVCRDTAAGTATDAGCSAGPSLCDEQAAGGAGACTNCIDTTSGGTDLGCNAQVPFCDGAGSCGECLVSDDCAAGEICDVDSMACTGCTDDEDCVDHPRGTSCQDEDLCGCQSALDCDHPAAAGPTCNGSHLCQ